MIKIGFVIRENTFLNCVFTLILATNRNKHRGSNNMIIVEKELDVLNVIKNKKIDSVIVQDAQHQFPFICKKLNCVI